MKPLVGFEKCEFWHNCNYYNTTKLICIGNLDTPLKYACSEYHYKKVKIKK